MEEIIKSIQEKVAEVTEVKFIDENTGQLDAYTTNLPVKWPCVLIDVNNVRFSNIGRDNNATPQNRQTGEYQVEFRVANLKLSQTSFKAPLTQKSNAWSIWSIIDKLHEKLHGFRPVENGGALIREGVQRAKREDGVQEYVLIYSSSLSNC